MPLLAALLGNAFSGVVVWLSAFVSKKLAMGAALAAFLIAGWVALQVALLALWTGLAFSLPSSVVGPLAVVSYLLPSNTAGCLEALVLAKIGRWLWDRQREWGIAMAQV
jgi:hypothetical protein